jgi:5'-deoxynucleotidase YfbR-like HD superfamily hydrolase
MKLFSNAQEILEKQASEVDLPAELNPIFSRLNYPRRGWLKRNISEDGLVESALQHTAKLALAAAAINPQAWNIDQKTLRQQCIIHELSEILGTDWTPGEISFEEKLRLEEAQLKQLLPENFPDRSKIIQLWEDYEKGGLAYYLDKMDAVVTAEYYALHHRDYQHFADEFHTSAQTKITDPTLKEIIENVRKVCRHSPSDFTSKDVFPFYFEQLKNC